MHTIDLKIHFKYELMITPDLLEELETWRNDHYFVDSYRQFNSIHEKTIQFSYDPFLHENTLEYHTDASGYRLGVYDVNQKISFSRQLSLDEHRITDIAGYEALG